MITNKQYLNFTKNGIYSGDMGVTHVSLNSGLYEESLGGNRNIIEQQNAQTDRRYYKRISRDPIEFDMVLALEDEITDEQIDTICQWLLNDYYEELYFENEVDRIYYCLPISQPTITHNGMNQGYITIQMRCFDGYLYSREFTKTFDLTANPLQGTIITLDNEGHVDNYPLLAITSKDFATTNITIQNLKTNESFIYSGLAVSETITVDNNPESEDITSSTGAFRYDNHNDVFVRIVGMGNQFKVYGKCTLTFKYRYKRKF